MLRGFIDFVDDILPSVSPDFRDGAKNAIAQFEKEGAKVNYLTNKPLSVLSQGDILTEIPFVYYDENGKVKQFKANAMIISTSCNIDRKENLLFVPVLPVDKFTGKVDDLYSNQIFDYMYLHDDLLKNQYIDFSHFCTYNRNLIKKVMESGKVKRVASLNQIGYYFFIVKLTVYLMRKEDTDTLNERFI